MYTGNGRGIFPVPVIPFVLVPALALELELVLELVFELESG
jgi:hypothetical protein